MGAGCHTADTARDAAEPPLNGKGAQRATASVTAGRMLSYVNFPNCNLLLGLAGRLHLLRQCPACGCSEENHRQGAHRHLLEGEQLKATWTSSMLTALSQLSLSQTHGALRFALQAHPVTATQTDVSSVCVTCSGDTEEHSPRAHCVQTKDGVPAIKADGYNQRRLGNAGSSMTLRGRALWPSS